MFTNGFHLQVIGDHNTIVTELISQDAGDCWIRQCYRKLWIDILMNEMSTIANRIGAILIVVHIPYLIREQTNPAPPELLDSLNKDIIFINLAPIVIQYYDNPGNPLLHFEHDEHPNALAHKLIAHEIKSVLKREKIF